jgi:hypothetical protein
MPGFIIRVSMIASQASKIFAAHCARLNLGYLDPASLNLDEWQ